MKRRYKLRKIVNKRSYTTEEIAELLGVHAQTVRMWRKEGLQPIEMNTSPFLFLGNAIKDFLEDALSKQKTKLNSDECYCLKCRKAVLPINPTIIDRNTILGNGKASAFITGKCPRCSQSLRKFISIDKSEQLEGANKNEDKPKRMEVTKINVNSEIEQMSLFRNDGAE